MTDARQWYLSNYVLGFTAGLLDWPNPPLAGGETGEARETIRAGHAAGVAERAEAIRSAEAWVNERLGGAS